MTNKKFVAVLNKKIEFGRLMNAFGHMTVGLVGKYDDVDFGVADYLDRGGTSHLGSAHPFIVLKAKNSSQIRTLRNQAIETGIPFASQNNTLMTKTDEEQLRLSKITAEEDLEYYGICLFGSSDELDEITKKFSLWN